MQPSQSKRAFLKGRFRRPEPMRPPGALSEQAFVDSCTRCGDCVSTCPEAIIIEDDEGFPVVNLHAGACTFCNKCADACETDSLQPVEGWNWRAGPSSACMSLQGITCRTCEDHCDTQSIRFRPQVGGKSEPVFDTDTCIGCGACAAACPTGAITFHQVTQIDGDQRC